MTEKPLKPCPFCGGKPHKNGPDNPGRDYWISCMSCQASSLMRSNEEATISAWNTRAQSDVRAPAAAIAEDCAKIAEGHIGNCSAAGMFGQPCGCYDEACRDIAKAIRDTYRCGNE